MDRWSSRIHMTFTDGSRMTRTGQEWFYFVHGTDAKWNRMRPFRSFQAGDLIAVDGRGTSPKEILSTRRLKKDEEDPCVGPIDSPVTRPKGRTRKAKGPGPGPGLNF